MENNYLPIPKNFSTLCIHAGKNTEDSAEYSCIAPPVISSTNFKIDFKKHGDGQKQKYVYSTIANPTRDNLEKCLAGIEGAKHAIPFSSGSGGLTSLLAALNPGSHVICSNAIFGGTLALFNNVGKTFSFTTSFIDVYDLKKVEDAIQPNTSLIWIETISNPLMKVADVRGISKIAKRHNVLFAVDNTFLTPYFHRPLELGADIACYSLTKHINGHSDVVMGAMVLNNKELSDKLKNIQYVTGTVPSSFDCTQVLRSLKTLPLRMNQHSLNAIKVGQYLETHPKVTKVVHPGLPSHPQHELFKSQTAGHSGVIAFYVDSDPDKIKQLLNDFKLITPTASFGSIESIVEIPILLSQSSVPTELRDPNVTKNLIRLSVGLENHEDIINDLKQALDKL